jgi:hypothetical protein
MPGGKPCAAALSGMPHSVNMRQLIQSYLQIMYSFYELFAHYAKHLERFFATSETPDWCAYEFHQLLLESIGSIAQDRYHSPSLDHILNGEQLEALCTTIENAERDCKVEDSLKHMLHRFNYPCRIFAPNPEDYPEEHEIYKQCCPSKSVEG